MITKYNASSKNEIISSLLLMISENESYAFERISLVASENVLSPLAKLPFLLDFHSRYFLDDLRRFGKWYFPGGAVMGEIEKNILIPLLSDVIEATYIEVRPISGMNCMMVAMTALTKPGQVVLTIPVENGGHVSTQKILNDIALEVKPLPFSNPYDIDFDHLEKLLRKTRPALIYLDQANLLFPIDPQPIRNLINLVSPETLIHYDSSHINGLIIGKALFNPLQRGAHCMGGSTHKTLPGPHKGFLATNDPDIAMKIQSKADYLISHNHTSSMISLAVTLMEMKWCNGDQYAKKVILNTKEFGKILAQNSFHVAAEDRGYTNCHQLWAYPTSCKNIEQFSHLLTEMGIIVNLFDSLPGINQPVFRFSLAEATKRGATLEDARLLASIISNIREQEIYNIPLKEQISNLKGKFVKTKFCYDLSDLNKNARYISDNIKHICDALFKFSI